MERDAFIAMRDSITCPTDMRIVPIDPFLLAAFNASDNTDIMPDWEPTSRVGMLAVAHRTVNVDTGEPLDVSVIVQNTPNPEQTVPTIFYAFFVLANHAICEEARYNGDPVIMPHLEKGWNHEGVNPNLPNILTTALEQKAQVQS